LTIVNGEHTIFCSLLSCFSLLFQSINKLDLWIIYIFTVVFIQMQEKKRKKKSFENLSIRQVGKVINAVKLYQYSYASN